MENSNNSNSLFKFITEQDQKINFAHYVDEVKRAQSTRDLAQIAKIVISEQQKPNGNYFFPKGKSKEFWALYRDAKAELMGLEDKQTELVPQSA